MTDQPRRDKEAPNSASEMEKAEGSRDTVKSNAQHGAGITNRPLEAEQQEQESLPPRGQNKSGGHA
jgi:hypothetical protein